MAINLNTNPYYDDFDDAKNYVKVLFKPGYAVQARELTQLQTAIQKQISRFGSHIFKDGSLVLNGNTTTTNCSWIDVLSTVNTNTVINKTIVGGTSEAMARVISAKQVNATTLRLYIVYQSGAAFAQDETVTVQNTVNSFSTVDNESFYGNAIAYSIDDSVFFVNGYFAFCEKQTIILVDSGTQLNYKVGILYDESIVSYVNDSTLLDPAQGSYNYSAPGADRYAINLVLTKFASSGATPENFIELSRYVNGELVYRVTNASYSNLEDNLARRTYDESGDYTVRAFSAKVVENINNDDTKLSIAIGPGKAYVKGYEFESIATTYKDLDKARDTQSATNVNTQASFGDYLVVNTPSGDLVYNNNQQINLVSGSTVIGTAIVNGIECVTSNRFKLFLYDFSLKEAYSANNITSVSSSSVAWSATVDTSYYTTEVTLSKAPNRTFIVPINQSNVKTLLDGVASSTEYETIDSFSGNVSSNTIQINAGTGQEFLSVNPEDYVVFNTTSGARVEATSVTLGTSNLTATLTFGTASFNARIVAPVIYRNVLQKSKNLQTQTLTFPIEQTRTFSLGYSDCYDLVAVIAKSSSDPLLAPIAITNKFSFYNGQTDELYDHGSITLNPGETIPNSYDSIEVTFKYFSQGAAVFGFFSVDSYAIDYDKIPSYTSSAGVTYRLSDCFDFRPRRATNSTAIIGKGLATPGSRISFDYEFYVSRIDKLVLTKERKFDLIRGIPNTNPEVPADLYDAMTLYILKIPAYTSSPELVSVSYVDNRRYTMRDIGKIDKKIERLEYYTALSFLEKQAKDEVIYDNLGTERFKNGILVDSFSGHSVGDVNNYDYSCSINKETRTLRPRFASNSFNYVVNTLGSARKYGDLVTLPIASTEDYIKQPFATGTVNLNPYQVFSWNGSMTLNPATDTWVDTQTKPDVLVNLNGENDVYTTLVNNVNNPAAVGVNWNDWQTVVRGVSVTQDLTNQISRTESEIGGRTLETLTNSISSSVATTTDLSSFRTGVKLATSAVSTVERSLGTKVTDVSLVPYIRSRLVNFAAKNLKPNTRLYASFDGVDVTSECTPAVEVVFAAGVTVPETATSLKNASSSKTATIVMIRKNRVFVIMDDSKPIFAANDALSWVDGGITSATNLVQVVNKRTNLQTNDIGDIAGVFLVPNSERKKFTVGEKAFRLADSLGPKPTTAAETKYVAQGMSQSLERTMVATRVATASVSPVSETVVKTSQTTTSTVTASTTQTNDITKVPNTINLLASEAEDNGDFGVGKTGKFEYNLNYGKTVITSASGLAATNTITVSSTTGIVSGMSVTGTGIASGSTVSSISGATVTLSSNLTAAVSGSDNVTFSYNDTFLWIGIKFKPTIEPVRYTIYFDGKEYTTGFVGSSTFDDRLVALGFPKTVGTGTGKLFFKRSTSIDTVAKLVIESPFSTAGWRFVVPTPKTTDPSVTLESPKFSITADKTTASEQDTITFIIDAPNSEDGTVLYWRHSTLSTVTAADFVDGLDNGTVTVSGKKATLVRTVTSDVTTEGNELLSIDIRIVAGTLAPILASSQSVVILDTSILPTYAIVADKTNVTETAPNNVVTFTVTTSGVANGTVLYWTTSGTAAAADFSDGVTQNTVTINNNTATITRTIASDVTTEGAETFVIQLRTTSYAGTIVAISQTINIADTSGAVTYALVGAVGGLQGSTITQVGEGEQVVFTISTSNIANNTTIYWRLTPTSNATSADFSTATTGTATIINNSAIFTQTVLADLTTEGNQTFTFEISDTVGFVAVRATSQQFTILDTSTNPPVYSITPNIRTVESPTPTTITFTVRAQNIANGTSLWWRIDNGLNAAWFSGPLEGEVIVNSGVATFNVSTATTYIPGSTVIRGLLYVDFARTILAASSDTINFDPKIPFVNIVGESTNRAWTPIFLGLTGQTVAAQSPTFIFNWGVATGTGSTIDRDISFATTTGTRFNFNFNVELPDGFSGVSVVSSQTLPYSATANETVSVTVQIPAGIPVRFTEIPITVIGEWSHDPSSPILDPRFVGRGVTTRESIVIPVIQLTFFSDPITGERIDPIAQTFFVDARNHPDGIYVKSIDLFFKTRSSSIPVEVQLRPTVNGYPSSTVILPFGRATKTANEINISTNGTAATTFEFENIVHLAPGEYSFVILSNTDEYELFTATLGDFSLEDATLRVTEQPTLGSMFKSQNSYAWTPVQEEDVKFTLRKCVFPVNTTVPVVYDTDVKTTNGNVPYELFYTTGEVVDFATTNIDYAFNNGSGWVDYQLGSNVAMSTEKTLVAAIPSSLQFRTNLSTTNKDITPVVDLNRMSNVLVHNIINNDASGETRYEGGTAVAKYITRKVKLAPGFDAKDLKVFLYANTPSGTSVKVFYKVSTASDTFFDDNSYTEMVVENQGSYSDTSFVEYKYKTPFNVDGYNVALASGERFDTFTIKIVMLSNTSTKVPQIRDLRAIALDD